MKDSIRRTIAKELDKELKRIGRDIEKRLGWKPPKIQVSRILAGALDGRKIKVKKRSKREWDINFV